LIVAAGAPRPTCFRPPYGATNEDVLSVAEELGLEVVLWTVASLDTVHQEPDGIIASTLAIAAPGDVVLMHDHWASAHEIALPIIIESLLEQGVGFGPICVPVTGGPGGIAPSVARILDLIR
jgi:peptidoglycan/xylan/chitin deacetylase (PgdA/CDA1 family)